MSETKVVIFEDESLLANDLKRQIEEHGYDVMAIFRKAEEGLIYLNNLKCNEEFPELVLMDIFLAGEMDGLKAAEYISKNFHCALVFLTGMSQMEIFEEAYRSKPHAFLVKPFDIHHALISIKLALYQKKLEDNLLEYQNELENRIVERTKELEVAKESAVAAIKLKDTLLSSVGQQIRDPMYGIKGIASILDEKSKGMPDIQQYLKYLDDNVDHLFSLLNKIMKLNHDAEYYKPS